MLDGEKGDAAVTGDALDRLIIMAAGIPEAEWAKIPEDFSQTYRSRKYDGEALSITADQVDEYRAKGWTVEPFTHHHGAAGYWLATRACP